MRQESNEPFETGSKVVSSYVAFENLEEVEAAACVIEWRRDEIIRCANAAAPRFGWRRGSCLNVDAWPLSNGTLVIELHVFLGDADEGLADAMARTSAPMITRLLESWLESRSRQGELGDVRTQAN